MPILTRAAGARPTQSGGLVLALLLALAPLTDVGAQVLVGDVVEAGTGTPLAGAFIRLVNDEGDLGGGVLSGRDGNFVLTADEPGHYGVIAELIGYGDPGTTSVTLRADESVRITLEIPVEPVNLEGLTAAVGERCRPRPSRGLATAQLWEEARKALEVTRWAARTDVARYGFVEFERERSAATLEVLREERRDRAGYYSGSPYRSVAAESLAQNGYVRPAPEDGWVFLAPDAETLMSDSFLDTHCFQVVAAAPDESGLVGLGLEPVPGRGVPDIEGVLWLDAETGALERLDFRYVDLPFEHGRDWDQIGGRVEFERLETGLWIVRRWYIRMPLATRIRGPAWNLTQDLVTIIEQGAEVQSIIPGGG